MVSFSWFPGTQQSWAGSSTRAWAWRSCGLIDAPPLTSYTPRTRQPRDRSGLRDRGARDSGARRLGPAPGGIVHFRNLAGGIRDPKSGRRDEKLL